MVGGWGVSISIPTGSIKMQLPTHVGGIADFISIPTGSIKMYTEFKTAPNQISFQFQLVRLK